MKRRLQKRGPTWGGVEFGGAYVRMSAAGSLSTPELEDALRRPQQFALKATHRCWACKRAQRTFMMSYQSWP